MKYKLIALDLDGTLLNSNKVITEYTYRVLERAANAGVQIVPASGRFFDAMPDCVRNLPFVNYAITINGASIYDVKNKTSLSEHSFKPETAFRIIDLLEHSGVAFDVCAGNYGYIDKKIFDSIDKFIENPHYIKNIAMCREHVDNVSKYLKEFKLPVNKIQFYSKKSDDIKALSEQIRQTFSDIIVSTAGIEDAEVNDISANKGNGLIELCKYLNIDISQTIAMGDSANDIDLFKTAGLSVAMKNAKPMILEIADCITASNDEDGVAKAIEKFVL